MFFDGAFQRLIDLMMLIFLRKHRLTMTRISKVGNLTLTYGTENSGEGYKSAEMTRYSSTIEVLLEYMENDSGRLWSTKQKTKLTLWIGRINGMQKKKRKLKEGAWIPELPGRFSKKGKKLWAKVHWKRLYGYCSWKVPCYSWYLLEKTIIQCRRVWNLLSFFETWKKWNRPWKKCSQKKSTALFSVCHSQVFAAQRSEVGHVQKTRVSALPDTKWNAAEGLNKDK